MGYFARIAAQSGLRLPGPQGRSRLPAAAAMASVLAPTGHDETAFLPPDRIPPGQEPDSAEGRMEGRRIDPIPPGPDEDAAAIGARTGQAQASRREETRPGAVPASGPGPMAAPGSGNTPSAPEPPQGDPGSAGSAGKPAKGAPSVLTSRFPEANVFAAPVRNPIEAAATEAGPHPTDSGRAEAGRNTVAAGDDPSPAPGYASGKKEYFGRTAGILGKGGAAEEDVQAMVFRDVREWIADSLPDVDPITPYPAQAGADPVADPPARPLRPRETAFARLREEPPAGRSEGERPIERNFNLSIGAISVVIEGPESSRPVDPPPRPAPSPAEGSARDKGSRSSRMGRSYL